MGEPIVVLATARPDLREMIDEVADLAWLMLTVRIQELLREKNLSYPLKGINGLDVDRINEHLYLLACFVRSAQMAGAQSAEWTGKTLLVDLKEVLLQLYSELPPEASKRDALAPYASVCDQFERNCGDVEWLLRGAEACFGMMVELESLEPEEFFYSNSAF